MHQNRNQAIDWVVQEGGISDENHRIFLEQNWNLAGLDALPSGVDYFILDSIIVCGFFTVGNWVAVLTRGSFTVPRDSPGSSIRIGPQSLDPVTLIHALELLRRRRHRTELDWDKNRTTKTNRVNRVVRRAVKLASGDKTDENTNCTIGRVDIERARDYLDLGTC